MALSPGMAIGIKMATPEKPVTILPNMADCGYYLPQPKPQYYRGVPVEKQLVTSYFGALGKANKVKFLLKLAESCISAGFTEATFFIAGAGAEEELLKQYARQKQLANVHFLGELNREEIR